MSSQKGSPIRPNKPVKQIKHEVIDLDLLWSDDDSHGDALSEYDFNPFPPSLRM